MSNPITAPFRETLKRYNVQYAQDDSTPLDDFFDGDDIGFLLDIIDSLRETIEAQPPKTFITVATAKAKFEYTNGAWVKTEFTSTAGNSSARNDNHE